MKKVKVYSVCTESHEKLRDEYFLPSLPKNLEPMVYNVDSQGSGGGKWKTPSFKHAIKNKLSMTLDAVNENMGDIFIISDLDLYYFREFDPYEFIEDYDIVGQRAYTGKKGEDYICGGFYICRASELTKKWIETCIEDSPKSNGGLEQATLHKWRSKLGLKSNLLDDRFLSPRQAVSKGHLEDWLSKDNGKLSKELFLFHANFISGLSAKRKLIDKVISWVEKYKQLPEKELCLKQMELQKTIMEEFHSWAKKRL
tara:strand:+ start:1262 stop:2026 length:765 start_codon:yes stop_codon:yes gene_type:complete